MNKIALTTILLCLFTGSLLCAQTDSTGTVEIEVQRIRSSEGQIAIGMNTSSKGWPRKAEFIYQWAKDGLKDSVLIVQINDLAYGTYAISMMDDVNSDFKLDMFLGIPREAYGFSMNPKNRLRAPKFDECSFELNQPFLKLYITLKYPGKDK